MIGSRLGLWARTVLFLGLGTILWQGAALAQDAAPVDPAFEEAKLAFESMPLENRILIQRSLVWTVPFNGAALGTFGKLTYRGILAFEKNAGMEENGILTSDELDMLVSEAEAAQKKVKFETVTDKKSGVKIGLPLSLLTKRTATSLGGKWSNADGSIAVETAIGTGTASDLAAAYERYLALPDRKVTYKLLRPDFFVVTGENGPNNFYVRYAGNETGIRGFTFRYPAARQKQMDRYVIAAANTFEPFPGAPAFDPGTDETAPKSETEPKSETVPKPDAVVMRHFTAIALADGSVVAPSASIAACKELKLADQTVTAKGGAGGLSTLSAAGIASSLGARDSAPGAGEPVVVLSATRDGRVDISPGSMVSQAGTLQVETALQADGAGAAVIDRQGRLVGIVTGDPANVKMIAGITPVARFALALQTGTAGGNGDRLSAGAIAETHKGSVMSLACTSQ